MTGLSESARRLLLPALRRTPRVKRWLAAQEHRIEVVRNSLASRVSSMVKARTRSATVAITAACNLRCVGCRYGRDFMVGERLSWEMLRDIVDDSAEAGLQVIRYYGGEPLLHPDLPRVIAHTIDRGISPYVTTNAVLLEKKFDELYEAGLRFMTIGFYGNEGAYDSYVQRDGAFEKAERGIAYVRQKYGDSVRIRINWLLRRQSCDLDALRKMWSFASKYETPVQVDLVHYSLPYFTEGPDRQLQFEQKDRAALQPIIDELLHYKAQRPDLIEASEMGIRSIPDWLLKGSEMKVPCDARNMIWIGADGSVKLCYVTFDLGNLHENRLSEILYTDAHHAAARGAFDLNCPNCHCGYDKRIQQHAASRKLYGK